jgi:hypothetical protein
MERDDLLCSRNARLFHRLRLRLRLSSDQSCLGVFPPLNLDLSLGLPMRRAQWRASSPPSRKQMDERCSFDARSKGQPWPLP